MKKGFTVIELMIVLAIIGIVFAIVVGAYNNKKAKVFGGTITKTLQVNTKLINVTWKDSNLWLVTRPMRPDEKAERYEFKEVSEYGILEGVVVIVESDAKKAEKE